MLPAFIELHIIPYVLWVTGVSFRLLAIEIQGCWFVPIRFTSGNLSGQFIILTCPCRVPSPS